MASVSEGRCLFDVMSTLYLLAALFSVLRAAENRIRSEFKFMHLFALETWTASCQFNLAHKLK